MTARLSFLVVMAMFLAMVGVTLHALYERVATGLGLG